LDSFLKFYSKNEKVSFIGFTIKQRLKRLVAFRFYKEYEDLFTKIVPILKKIVRQLDYVNNANLIKEINELIKDNITITYLAISWNMDRVLIINLKFTCAINIFIKNINRTLDMPKIILLIDRRIN